MRRVSKGALQIFGFGLMVIGVMLLIIGQIGLNENQPQVYNCALNGCGPEIDSAIRSQHFWYTISLYSFYSGEALTAEGIVVLFAGWRLDPEVARIPVRTLPQIELFLTFRRLRQERA